MKNSNPSLDPADNGTMSGMMQFCFNKLISRVENALPAKVVAYDRTTNRAQVQPMIALIKTDSSTVSRAQIASVPVFQFGGGGYMLSFNLVPGNLGWIIANDRDISLFLSYYKESKPNTSRVHSFGDAFFLPDIMTGYTISPEDSGNAVLQNAAGTVKISLGTGKIKISAPIVEIDGLTSVSINSPVTVTMTTPVLAVNGNITATGSITPGA